MPKKGPSQKGNRRNKRMANVGGEKKEEAKLGAPLRREGIALEGKRKSRKEP